MESIILKHTLLLANIEWSSKKLADDYFGKITSKGKESENEVTKLINELETKLNELQDNIINTVNDKTKVFKDIIQDETD